jgi:hypothetical protein
VAADVANREYIVDVELVNGIEGHPRVLWASNNSKDRCIALLRVMQSSRQADRAGLC